MLSEVNAQIERNRAELNLQELTASLEYKYQSIHIDLYDARGRKIERIETMRGQIYLLFADGKYASFEYVEEYPFEGHVEKEPRLSLDDLHRLGLMSNSDWERLVAAREAVDALNAKATALAQLRRAVAVLGIEEVRRVVG